MGPGVSLSHICSRPRWEKNCCSCDKLRLAPRESDARSLNSTLLDHGWTPEGSFYFRMDILDSIVVDRVRFRH